MKEREEEQGARREAGKIRVERRRNGRDKMGEVARGRVRSRKG